jgi:hypothetical protein
MLNGLPQDHRAAICAGYSKSECIARVVSAAPCKLFNEDESPKAVHELHDDMALAMNSS